MNTLTSIATLPTGSAGYSVFDEDGVEVISRTTDGVVQIFAGSDFAVNSARIVVPDAMMRGVVLWSNTTIHEGDAVAKAFKFPFSDEQIAALRAFAVNTEGRTIDILTAPPREILMSIAVT